jgi:peptidoglycan/xylan/chitin deacetylase (PgdA/CDA1 family)
MKLLIGFVLALFTCASHAQGVPIIAYHRVVADRAPGMTVIAPDRFVEHMNMLKTEGYTLIRIDELVSYMRNQITLPTKTVAVTFDDGWKDQLFAAKILSSAGLSATFYITSGHFSDPRYMTVEDVQELAQNPQFEIGAHSHTHFPELDGKDPTSMDPRAMIGELIISKLLLEQTIGKKVQNYAWPFGYATLQSVQFAERLGFASTAMINTTSANIPGRTMELQRLNIDGRCTADQLKQMLETGALVKCL